jgi:fluoroquinolone resistance protein
MNEILNQNISGQTYGKEVIEDTLFEDCHFLQCQFHHTPINMCVFRNCVFEQCSWLNLEFSQCKFQTVELKECKIQGIYFHQDEWKQLELYLHACRMELCVFEELSLNRSVFAKSQVLDCSFFSCNLEGASFADTDLKNTLFEDNNLKKSDFRGATNYHFDPRQNAVKGARFSLPEVLGFLKPLGIKIS